MADFDHTQVAIGLEELRELSGNLVRAMADIAAVRAGLELFSTRAGAPTEIASALARLSGVEGSARAAELQIAEFMQRERGAL